MTKLRMILAILAGRAVRLVSRLLHRGGTDMPGRIALRLCPQLLRLLAAEVKSLAVTGTNGKTTSARMIEEAFREEGKSYFANRSGANLISGITTEFIMNADWRGRPRKQYAIIECDEAAAKKVFGQLKPRVVLVTNLFRDQLDRYGEVTHTLSELETAAKAAPDATLCLNADDSLIASLSLKSSNPVRFYGVGVSVPHAHDGRSDAPNCIRCGHRYEYEYRTYAHLGGFVCPNCGWRRPNPSVEVTQVRAMNRDGSEVCLRIGADAGTVRVPLPAVYNIYNALAAASALDAFGVDAGTIRASMHAAAGFGRMERFPIGKGVTMILVKNPAGFTQVLDHLAGMEEDFDLMCCLNDKAQDGRDISWIWDVPLEQLAAQNMRVCEVYVSGTRGAEMLLRLRHAGVPPTALHLMKNDRAFLRGVTADTRPLVVVPTYTAMMRLRPVLAKRTGKSAFWE